MMAYNTKAIKVDLNSKPIPQYFNPDVDEYEVLQGKYGASRAMLYGPDGNPIGSASGRLAVQASELDITLSALRDALRGVDAMTLSDLAALLTAIRDTALAKTTPADGQSVLASMAAQALLKALRNGDLTKEELLEALNGALFVNPRTSAGAELFTDAAPGAVKINGSTASVTIHHNAATSAGDGTDADVDGLHALALDINGTATSSTVLFLGSADGIHFRPVQAVNFATGAVATSTTGKDEMWQVDVTGLKAFRARLDAVAGGNITVVSNAIA